MKAEGVSCVWLFFLHPPFLNSSQKCSWSWGVVFHFLPRFQVTWKISVTDWCFGCQSIKIKIRFHLFKYVSSFFLIFFLLDIPSCLMCVDIKICPCIVCRWREDDKKKGHSLHEIWNGLQWDMICEQDILMLLCLPQGRQCYYIHCFMEYFPGYWLLLVRVMYGIHRATLPLRDFTPYTDILQWIQLPYIFIRKIEKEKRNRAGKQCSSKPQESIGDSKETRNNPSHSSHRTRAFALNSLFTKRPWGSCWTWQAWTRRWGPQCGRRSRR